jgi:SAM-dependent methyltransferase
MYRYFIIILILTIVIISIYLLTRNKDDNPTIEEVYLGSSFITVDNTSKGKEYNLTYGEITEPGIKNIIAHLKKNNIPISTYIDLGSGNGRSLAYAIKNGFTNAKGVEIVEERHNYAVKAIAKLPQYKDKIELVQSDIFKLQPNFFPNKTTIFVSNLLFPLDTNQKLLQFLSDNTPNDITLIVSKLPKELYKFKNTETIDVPMSWEKESKCYVLKK